MNWQVIFNPFSKFSEKQLFVIGLLFFLITSLVSFFTQNTMNSIFHFIPSENLIVANAILYIGICYSSAVIYLFIIALIFNKKTRLIDIVNTVLISQAPNFIILLIIKFSSLNKLSKSLKTAIDSKQLNNISLDLGLVLLFILPFLAFAIYGIVLIFNGFKTATNIKKPQHIIFFIISLFVFMLIHQIYMQSFNL